MANTSPNMIQLSNGYYRTLGGRAYIEYRENAEVWRIIACNGDFKGYAKTFEEAVEKALKV